MGLWGQIALGTAVMSLCAAVHIGLIVVAMKPLSRMDAHFRDHFTIVRAGLLIGSGFALTVFGHTVQVWIWALALLLLGAFQTIELSVYFALASFTTLGYGDITLGEDIRVFGAFSAVTGMLTFGVSTAFLVGLIGRALPKNLH